MQARLVQIPNKHVKIVFPPLLSRYRVSVSPATSSIDVSMFQSSACVGADGNFTIYRAPIRFRYSDDGTLYVFGESYSAEEIEFAKNIIEITISGAGPIINTIYESMPLPLFEEVAYNYPAEDFAKSMRSLLDIYKKLIAEDAPFDICAMAQEWTGRPCADSVIVNPADLRSTWLPLVVAKN